MDWTALIPVISPILVAFVKMLVPKLPKFLLPILTPIFGAGLQALESASGMIDQPVDAMQGALLGSVGVFIREVVDQIKKAIRRAASLIPPPLHSTDKKDTSFKTIS